MKINRHTIRCLDQHFGPWSMHLGRFWSLHDFIMGENITFEDADSASQAPEKRSQEEIDNDIVTPIGGGILVVEINGTMMRAQSSFGGTSTVQVRRILQKAARNDKVKGVMLAIDSPGGTVAGTDELAEEIKAFGQIKTIHAHVGGLMASAAFWVGSQVSRITAARTSEIGSLGTVAVVHDMSEAAKKEGIKVHVISTGDHKGAFTPGSKVTEAQLKDLQATVNKLNAFFMEAVQGARGFTDKETKDLFDGRVHVADDALKLGLIDGISSFEEAIRVLENEVSAKLHEDDDDEEEALAIAKSGRYGKY